MYDAYMIRNDGKQFPVQVHYYMPQDDIYRSMEAGEWLCESALNINVRYYFNLLVAFYLRYVVGMESVSLESVLEKLINLYNPVSEHYVKENHAEILKQFEHVENDILKYLEPLRKIMDTEFIRERIGGMYETNYGNRDCYFRISSVGFNWYPIIWEFVYTNRNSIDTVTIVRDYSSTGVKDKYYSGSSGEYKSMPVNDFITEKGNPVIEVSKYLPSVRRALLEGKVLLTYRELEMNPERARRDYISLLNRENSKPRFWYIEDVAINRILAGENIQEVLSDT